MDSYRRSKAQSILEKHIDELRSIYEKKEAEQKILNQKKKILKAELEKLNNKEKSLATINSINRTQYIKPMRS